MGASAALKEVRERVWHCPDRESQNLPWPGSVVHWAARQQGQSEKKKCNRILAEQLFEQVPDLECGGFSARPQPPNDRPLARGIRVRLPQSHAGS